MKSIYLIRHGRQNDARCNVNVPLSVEGHRQAELLGKRIRNYGIEKLYASHLVRAIETAQDINHYLQIPFEEVDGIEEIDFGDLTGHTAEYIKKNYADFQKLRNSQTSDLAYPGGETGMDVIHRAYPKLLELLAQPENTIAIVTHGGVIRAMLAYLLDLDLRYKLSFAKDLENCSITHLLYDERQKKFYLERLNDYAHIELYEELLRKGWNNLKL